MRQLWGGVRRNGKPTRVNGVRGQAVVVYNQGDVCTRSTRGHKFGKPKLDLELTTIAQEEGVGAVREIGRRNYDGFILVAPWVAPICLILCLLAYFFGGP